jgi:hypothetical protein
MNKELCSISASSMQTSSIKNGNTLSTNATSSSSSSHQFDSFQTKSNNKIISNLDTNNIFRDLQNLNEKDISIERREIATVNKKSNLNDVSANDLVSQAIARRKLSSRSRSNYLNHSLNETDRDLTRSYAINQIMNVQQSNQHMDSQNELDSSEYNDQLSEKQADIVFFYYFLFKHFILNLSN